MSAADIAAAEAACVEIPVRFDFDSLAPSVSAAVTALHRAAATDLKNAGIDQGLIVSINAWNEIGVTSRCWPVGARAE
jgi:hypothetical protein